MAEIHLLKKGLLKQMWRIKRSLEAAFLLQEQAFITESIILAGRTMRMLDRLIDDLRKANEETKIYMNMTLKNKWAGLDEDRAYLTELEKQAEDRDVEAEQMKFNRIISRLHRLANTLESEIRHIFPNPPFWRPFFRNNKKKIVLVGAAAAFLVIGYYAIQFLRCRGRGLEGAYYHGTNFGKLAFHKVDKTINFNWTRKAPSTNFNTDNFSVRWSGWITIPKDSEYVFYTISDDGVRLWIDDNILIDNWAVHFNQLDQGTARLTRGPHKLKLEYFQNTGGAIIQLLWKKPGGLFKQIVSPAYLRSSRP
ncbi:MAG: hypothetical protein LHV69_05055 [Elusimicrobia bacterium]|nr:hypothetical protein [Candidatus Obscuribacterium magneticum]